MDSKNLPKATIITKNEEDTIIYDHKKFVKSYDREKAVKSLKKRKMTSAEFLTIDVIDTELTCWPILDAACERPALSNFKFKVIAKSLLYPNRLHNQISKMLTKVDMDANLLAPKDRRTAAAYTKGECAQCGQDTLGS